MSNILKTTVLLGAMSALFLMLGEALGGAQGMVLGLFMAGAMNFASYWFSDKIVLSMYSAKEVGPGDRLYEVVARLAQRAGLPMPRVYIIPDMSPNAFATGRSPDHAAVAATEGILRILTNDELDGVIAHELSHVKNRDILISSVAATLAAAIMVISRFAMFFGGGQRDNDRGSNPIALLATVILAPIAAMLIQAAISRSREYRRRRRRFGPCRRTGRTRQRTDEDRSGVPIRTDGCKSRDCAHVHHQAVFCAESLRPLFDTPSHRRTDQGASTEGVVARICGRKATDSTGVRIAASGQRRHVCW